MRTRVSVTRARRRCSLRCRFARSRRQRRTRLTVERIFASGEFAARGAGQLRWLDDSTYVALQANPQQNGAAELARFNARTGARDVLVPVGLAHA